MRSKPLIIFVDDEQFILSSLESEFSESSSLNCRIMYMNSSLEALRFIKECALNNTNIAAVISDYMMPDMKGNVLLEKVHEIFPETSKVILTYKDEAKNIPVLLNRMALDGYIEKPWDSFAFPKMMETLVKKYNLRKKASKTMAKLSKNNIELQELNEKLLLENNVLEDTIQNNTEEFRDTISKKQKADAIKHSFMSNLSHEIRTPMNAIVGMAELLSFTELDEMQQQYVNAIKQSSRVLMSIVKELLDISTIEAGEISVDAKLFRLKPFIDEITALFKIVVDKKNIDFITIPEKELPDMVIGDKIKVRQIIINLISNAIKFTEKGFVKFNIGFVMKDNTGILKVMIEDSGIGIPERYVHQIFDKYVQVDNYTTKNNSGIGVGLAISNELAKFMGGKITFESIEHSGSRFTFEVPLSLPKENFNKVEFIKIKDIKFPKASILIVEDNAINQLVAKNLVMRFCPNVMVAENGQEALEVLETKKIDLIFMDCQMPVMDGYELTKKIRSTNKPYSNIPIIALTAFAMDGDKEKCISSGMNDYISKPFKVDDIHHALIKYLKNMETLH